VKHYKFNFDDGYESPPRYKAPAERIKHVHPDCGFWVLPRSVADGKMRSLVRAGPCSRDQE
jgi:hypothetical protein